MQKVSSAKDRYNSSYHRSSSIVPFMWQETNQKLHASLLFKNFAEAFAFMTEVALIAEKMDHHPEWSNVWNRVDIQLCTHSAGNIITEKDRRLAAAIDEVFTKYQ